jgi:hypothetical protein
MATPNLGTLSQPLPMGGQTQGAAAPAPATGQPPPDGQTAMSRGKVMQAIQSISTELSNFPVGSEEHTALLDTIKKLGKYFSGWSTSTQAAPPTQQSAQQIAGSPAPMGGGDASSDPSQGAG